jgi:hypothetical protein
MSFQRQGEGARSAIASGAAPSTEPDQWTAMLGTKCFSSDRTLNCGFRIVTKWDSI